MRIGLLKLSFAHREQVSIVRQGAQPAGQRSREWFLSSPMPQGEQAFTCQLMTALASQGQRQAALAWR